MEYTSIRVPTMYVYFDSIRYHVIPLNTSGVLPRILSFKIPAGTSIYIHSYTGQDFIIIHETSLVLLCNMSILLFQLIHFLLKSDSDRN